MPPKRKPELIIGWTTITYRSVLLAILCVVASAGAASYMIAPQATISALDKTERWFSDLADRIGLGKTPAHATGSVGPQQAHFTNIDGTVRVKKSTSNTWVTADYNLPLDKGDVVQTGSEGMAKVVFADGTNYTIKQDSLIVIEENSTTADQKTNVAVQVTTGTVDLMTATFSQGSKSQVIVANATASLSPDTTAQVDNDPRGDTHEILVKKGSGEVKRGDEIVRLTDFEKVSFKADSPTMAKTKEIAPPTLISPANMMPVFFTGSDSPIDFSWTPMERAKAYHIRVSRNPYFSSIVFDKKVTDTNARVTGLGEGPYYWLVTSLDASGKESVESERNRFTLIPKGASDVALTLELDPFVQHGHVIEVIGKTESGARVMVNGDEVPLIATDGSFHYFTPPLPNGENVITITAQNAKGGVNTQQKKVVIQ